MTILGDNQAAIALAKNGGTWKSRHYAVKASALREAFRHGWAEVRFVCSAEQVADMFTKLLGAAAVRRLRQLAGMDDGTLDAESAEESCRKTTGRGIDMPQAAAKSKEQGQRQDGHGDGALHIVGTSWAALAALV